MSKKADIRKKNTAEIDKLVTDKREELRAFRFGSTGSRAKNVKAGRNIRKEIARALTERTLRQSALEGGKI